MVSQQKTPASLRIQGPCCEASTAPPPSPVAQKTASEVPLPPGMSAEEQAPVETPSARASLFPRGEPQPQRRTATDITAHASFAHAEDYKWISGKAVSYRGEWRLRYASIDEVDLYGGSLVLLGGKLTSDLKDGEQYKLTGYVVANDTRVNGPAFCVESVDPVKE
jgi:hypothetical protein